MLEHCIASCVVCQKYEDRIHGMNQFLYTVNRERFTGLNFCFSWFSELRKFFHEYKHLSLIVLHLWPKQHESISVKTSMVLKLWIFSLVNPSLSMVLGLLGRVIKKLATSWIMPSLALLLHMVLSMTTCSYVYD